MRQKHEVNYKMLALKEAGLSSGDNLIKKHNTKYKTYVLAQHLFYWFRASKQSESRQFSSHKWPTSHAPLADYGSIEEYIYTTENTKEYI